MANLWINPFNPMKSLLLLTIGFSAAAATLSIANEKAVTAESRVTVAYDSPEKFTDFNTSGFGSATDQDLKYLTGVFTAHIEKLAGQCIAADERLEITFKDIDLAGRFEPEHGPRMQDVRIFRDITFPRMELVFRLLGPDGRVRAEGERKLTDLNYNMNLRMPMADTEFRHDKALLTDWMNAEFKKKKT